MQALQPGVHEESDLLEIATRLACEGYWQDIKQVLEVSRVFRYDEALWDAMKDETGLEATRRPYRVRFQKRTRLMYAAWTYNPERVHFLLDRGARVNTTSVDGLSALQFATQQGAPSERRPSLANLYRPSDEQVDVVLELCSRGATVARSGDLLTPLMWASFNCLPKVVHALCKTGVDVNAVTTNGASALSWCLFTVVERQHALLRSSLYRPKVDESGERDFMVEKGRALETIKVLCKMGANGRDDCTGVPIKGTALLLAVDSNFMDIAQTMIVGGVSVDAARAFDGSTPLMMACELDNVDFIGFICSKGVNLDSPGMDGNTPLMRASELGLDKIVKLLCLKGANVNAARASDGATALMLATLQQHKAVAATLQEAGASATTLTIGPYAGKTSDDFAAAHALLNHFKEKVKAVKKPKTALSAASLLFEMPSFEDAGLYSGEEGLF